MASGLVVEEVPRYVPRRQAWATIPEDDATVDLEAPDPRYARLETRQPRPVWRPVSKRTDDERGTWWVATDSWRTPMERAACSRCGLVMGAMTAEALAALAGAHGRACGRRRGR